MKRFTDEERDILNKLQDKLGVSFVDHTFLLLTCGEDLKGKLYKFLPLNPDLALTAKFGFVKASQTSIGKRWFITGLVSTVTSIFVRGVARRHVHSVVILGQQLIRHVAVATSLMKMEVTVETSQLDSEQRHRARLDPEECDCDPVEMGPLTRCVTVQDVSM
ncbi:hypothetical protein WMY93_020995 [Mugilogobius chulae]|uniref:Uncharacterized protein n=1 Tax=Mugilogobius chulae TaxID=88201 RepID=A0AAW0NAJ1_9GOBI